MKAAVLHRQQIQQVSGDILRALDDLVSVINAAAVSTPWTPRDGSGAGLVLTQVQPARLVQIGPLVVASAFVTYPTTAVVSAASIAGLPFVNGAIGCGAVIAYQDANLAMTAQVAKGSTAIRFLAIAGGVISNANLSGKTVNVTAIYLAA